MEFYLGHSTSLEWLRACAGVERLRRITRARSFERSSFDARAARSLVCERIPWASRPAHFVVPCASVRSGASGLACHVWQPPLPSGAFIDAGGDLYVSSPEFTFLQAALDVDLIGLVMLGYELCGAYALAHDGGFVDRPALTTRARLASFVSRAGSARGAKRALRAVRYVKEGSASPRESALAMLMCLPCSLGGYGLDGAVLNKIVVPGKMAARTFARSFYRCDLLWPDARVGLEYDSDQFHAGGRAASRDSMRRADLETTGLHILSVTNRQIMNRSELDKIASVVEKRLGVKPRARARYDFFERQTKLRWRILSRNS